MECAITRLLKDGDRIAGAFGYWRENGRFVVFKAKSVVMATGGIGKAWQITSNSWEYTGDGMALAYDAGAELMDMEFVQFHPTGMVWPPGVQGILVTEAVRGEGGILRNHIGRALHGAATIPKRMELSTRDVVARAIYTEVKEGRGTEHGGAFLDISHKPAEYVKRKLPSMYHQFKELADVDITKGPMEVGPTCHYMMGGIRVEAETAQCFGPWTLCRRRSCRRTARRQSPGRKFAFRSAGVRPHAPGLAAAEHAKKISACHRLIPHRSKPPSAKCSRPSSAKTARVHTPFTQICRTPCRIWSASSAPKKTCDRRMTEIDKLKERSRAAGGRTVRECSIPAGTLRRDLQGHADGFRSGHPQCAGSPRESRGAQPH